MPGRLLLAQIAFTVAFGVLLDTIRVRGLWPCGQRERDRSVLRHSGGVQVIPLRLVGVALGLALGALGAVAVSMMPTWGGPETSRDASGAAAVSMGAEAARFPASDVLRRWDRSRSDAFAAGDVTALRDLYVDGAGAADVRLLETYLRRGLRVEGMRMQVLALEILADRPGVIRVRVTDRLTGAVAVGETGRVVLPRDGASTRLLELRRGPSGGAWRMASVREVR